MTVLDLTVPIPPVETQREKPDGPAKYVATVATHRWHIASSAGDYTARVHVFSYWSMSGTYIDFPGHVVETDDGVDAASASLADLFRVESAVLHLRRQDEPGAVSAAELEAAAAGLPAFPGLVLNALGDRRFDEVPPRSVYLSREAVAWMVARGVRLLVSDIYESATRPQNVFPHLFRAGIATVCCPAPLSRLPGKRARITALPCAVPGATQAPCRLIAEYDAGGDPGTERESHDAPEEGIPA